MPDWITHLGGGYLLYRPISRKDIRVLLLGTILPDVFSRVPALLDDVFHLPLPQYYQFGALHTPFMLLLLAAFIALFSTDFFRCLGLILGGGIFHILLDMTQTKFAGFGQLLFYPLSYKTYQLNLFSYKGWGYYLMVAAFFVLLLSYVNKPRINPVTFRLQRIGWAVPLLSLILLLPYVTWKQFWQHNVGYIVFRYYPERFENQEVALHFSRVVSTKPLIIEEGDNRFEVVTDQKFKLDDWISVNGKYRQGKLYPIQIRRELGRAKIWISLVGLLLFPFIWFDFPGWWAAFRQRAKPGQEAGFL